MHDVHDRVPRLPEHVLQAHGKLFLALDIAQNLHTPYTYLLCTKKRQNHSIQKEIKLW